ncbi:hypothetical protein GJ496_006380 [Pomphorhynchus laevis]|nr:hypothetical protein GJ496_006380 [Pomphorhynchus laevis]
MDKFLQPQVLSLDPDNRQADYHRLGQLTNDQKFTRTATQSRTKGPHLFMFTRCIHRLKEVGSSISNVTDLVQRLAQDVASAMLDSILVCDNTALYAKGWLLTFAAYSEDRYRRDNEGHQTRWRAADNNFNSRIWEADDLVNILREDIRRNNFVFHAKLGRINWPFKRISVYGDDRRDVPQYIAFDASEMKGLLIKMARSRYETLYLMLGYIRACNILGQTGITYDADHVAVMLNTHGGDNDEICDVRKPLLIMRLRTVLATDRQRGAIELTAASGEHGSNNHTSTITRSNNASTTPRKKATRPKATSKRGGRTTTRAQRRTIASNGRGTNAASIETEPTDYADISETDIDRRENWWIASGELASSRSGGEVRAEVDMLAQLEDDYLLYVSWAIAGCISLGCGLVLHENSIYGTILNNYHNPRPRASERLTSIGMCFFRATDQECLNVHVAAGVSLPTKTFYNKRAIPNLFKLAMTVIVSYWRGKQKHF